MGTDNNVYECETWIANEIVSETIENPSKSEDKPQKKEEVNAITLQQAKYSLKQLRNFVEITRGMENGIFLHYPIRKILLKLKVIKNQLS